MIVTVYSQANCQPCKATIRKLDELGIEYVVIDITSDQEAHDYVVSLGFKQTPVVVVGDQSWAGYVPSKIQKLRGL